MNVLSMTHGQDFPSSAEICKPHWMRTMLWMAAIWATSPSHSSALCVAASTSEWTISPSSAPASRERFTKMKFERKKWTNPLRTTHCFHLRRPNLVLFRQLTIIITVINLHQQCLDSNASINYNEFIRFERDLDNFSQKNILHQMQLSLWHLLSQVHLLHFLLH